MSVSFGLQLRQNQSLVMTPQLMQSIRLLQFSQIELERYIDAEIEANPLLQRDESAHEGPERSRTDGSEAHDPRRDDAAPDEFFEAAAAEPASYGSPGVGSSSREADGWSHRGGDLSLPYSGRGSDIDPLDLQQAGFSLIDAIERQIGLAFGDLRDRTIAMGLATRLDEAGYVRDDLDDLAFDLGTSRADLERVLGVCKTFEPTGLFAANLRECLELQLRALNRFDPAMKALLSHLDLLAARNFASLRRLCGVDDEDLVDMLAEIRRLNPYPGSGGGYEAAAVQAPEVTVSEAADGSWLIELKPEALPRVLVDEHYASQVSTTAAKATDRSFVSECLASANWLVRSLDQRARTILAVSNEIVRRQDDFLRFGVAHLRPMTLRTIAEAIGMHESTVSRVTANKTIETPRGVFPMRYFFSSALTASEGGDDHSSEAVRHTIRRLIDSERPDKVLSDDAIAEHLQKKGIDIARRTVAKYREQMNLPSSVQRRREKKARQRAAERQLA